MPGSGRGGSYGLWIDRRPRRRPRSRSLDPGRELLDAPARGVHPRHRDSQEVLVSHPPDTRYSGLHPTFCVLDALLGRRVLHEPVVLIPTWFSAIAVRAVAPALEGWRTPISRPPSMGWRRTTDPDHAETWFPACVGRAEGPHPSTRRTCGNRRQGKRAARARALGTWDERDRISGSGGTCRLTRAGRFCGTLSHPEQHDAATVEPVDHLLRSRHHTSCQPRPHGASTVAPY